MATPPTFPEVLEEHATGRVREIYEEIKAAFRTSVVNFAWRGLAVYPEYFDAMWQQIRPNAVSRYLARKAAEAQGLAVIPDTRVDLQARLRAAGVGDRIGSLRAMTDAYTQVNPKLLILIAGLEEGSHAIAGGHGLLGDVDSPTASPPPAPPPMVRLDQVSPEVGAVLEEIRTRRGWHGIPSVYRTMARHPAVLRIVWEALLRPVARTPTTTRAVNDLYWFSIAAARYLPYPVELGHRRLETMGISRAQGEEIRVKLGLFHRFIPEVMVDLARIKVALDGVEAALA